jgi:hypothetical protein
MSEESKGRRDRGGKKEEANSCVWGPFQSKENLGRPWLIPQKWITSIGKSPRKFLRNAYKEFLLEPQKQCWIFLSNPETTLGQTPLSYED